MAASDEIIGSISKMLEGDVGNNRPNSEAVNQKISANINKLIEAIPTDLVITHHGYFSNSSLFKSAPYRIKSDVDIAYYSMGVLDSGNSGNTTFNVAIYDNSGAFVNNLFGATTERLLISGNNGLNVIVGRDVDNASVFAVNDTGHTIQYGTLNVTSFTAGQILVPFIEGFATSARSLTFNLKLREV